MAAVRIDSGGIPSAEGVPEGWQLAEVIGHWQSVAHGSFREDCSHLLQMIEETDRLRLWEKNVGGFTYESRDEFLQDMVLIDFDLTERSLNDIVTALRRGDKVKLSKREEVDLRTQKAKELRSQGLTQQQIADQLGVSQQRVGQNLQENRVYTQKTSKPPRKVVQYKISQYTTPDTAAQKIRDKFGDEFADALADALKESL